MLFNNFNSYLNMNGLYGNTYSFGSSTNFFGGMNGYMGMNSVFGANGCNLFTNCNGTINFDSMAGFAVGNTLINYGFMALSSAIQNRRENKKPERNVAEDVQNINKLLNAELAKLGVETPKDAKAFKVEDKYTDAVNDAKTALSTAETELSSIQSKISNTKAEIYLLDPEAEGAPNKIKVLREKLAIYENDEKNKKAEIKNLQKEKETAEKAKADREKEIKDIQAKIADYADKLAGAQKKLNSQQGKVDEQILDNADGKKAKDRTVWTDNLATAKFDTTTGKLNREQAVSIEDLQGAIYAYRVAANDTEKIKYAKIFNLCYENMDLNDRTPEIRAARTVIPDKKEVQELEKKANS